jgi:hypothetical protein
MRLPKLILMTLLATLMNFSYGQTNSVIVKLNWNYLDLEKVDDRSLIESEFSGFLNKNGKGAL